MKKHLYVFTIGDTDNDEHVICICANSEDEAIRYLLTLDTLDDWDEDVLVLEVVQTVPIGIIANN